MVIVARTSKARAGKSVAGFLHATLPMRRFETGVLKQFGDCRRTTLVPPHF